MPKGVVFWIIWILCLLGFLGLFFGYERYAVAGSGAIVLILTGLLGWQTFGPPIKG